MRKCRYSVSPFTFNPLPVLPFTNTPDNYQTDGWIQVQTLHHAWCVQFIFAHTLSYYMLGVCINIEGQNAQVLKVPQWELWIWLIFQLGVPDVVEDSWYIVSFAFDGEGGWGTFWNLIAHANQRAYLLFVRTLFPLPIRKNVVCFAFGDACVDFGVYFKT